MKKHEKREIDFGLPERLFLLKLCSISGFSRWFSVLSCHIAPGFCVSIMVRSHSKAKRDDEGGAAAPTAAATRKRSKQPDESSKKEAKTTTTAQAKAAATPPPAEAPGPDFEICWENFAKVQDYFGMTPQETNLTLLKLLGPDPVMVARYAQDPKDITEPLPTAIPTSGWEEVAADEVEGIDGEDCEGEEEETIEVDPPIKVPPTLPPTGSYQDTVETQVEVEEPGLKDTQVETEHGKNDLKKNVELQATPAKAGGGYMQTYMSHSPPYIHHTFQIT